MKMRKLKRIFSMALASAMALSLVAIPVSATENNNGGTDGTTGGASTTSTYGTLNDPVTSVGVTKYVTVDKNGTLLPDMKFYITMKPATDDDLKVTKTTTQDDGSEKTETTAAVDGNGLPIETAPALKSDTLEFEFNASNSTSTGKASETKEFKFEFANDFTFDHTGVYRYVVTETLNKDTNGNQITNNGYITYDTSKFYVDCYVDLNKTTNKYVLYTYTLKKYGTDEKPENISFTNAVDCATIEIYKTVSGTEYQPGQLYTFRIMIPVGGTTIDLKKDQVILATINSAGGQVTDDDRTNDDGYVELKVTEANITDDLTDANSNKFTLKDGEWLQIIGAPVSMIYKVEEVVDEVTDTTINKTLLAQGYTTTYKYKEYGEFSSTDNTNTRNKTITGDKGVSVVQGTTNTETNEVTFINTRTVQAKTGINLDFAPYVLIVLIAVCGGILFIARKRRVER
jgi:hypothetical protein